MLQLPLRAPRRSRQYRSSRRHFRNGQRAAVLRAVTGARLYIGKAAPTLASAAACVGSNAAYVEAAIVLLRAEDPTLLDRALRGHVPLRAAAKQARCLVDLVTTYREARDEDRIAFARACGIEKIFETLVAASA
jgi:hypothetical protein